MSAGFLSVGTQSIPMTAPRLSSLSTGPRIATASAAKLFIPVCCSFAMLDLFLFHSINSADSRRGRGRKGHGKVAAGASGTQPSRKRKTLDNEGDASVKSKIQGSEPEAQPRARSVRQKKPGQRVAEAQLSQLVLELMSN